MSIALQTANETGGLFIESDKMQRIKNQHTRVIQNYIEHEFSLVDSKKLNSSRMNKLKLKEEKFNSKKEQIKREKDFYNQLKEKETEENIIKELEELIKRKKQKEQNIIKIKEDMKDLNQNFSSKLQESLFISESKKHEIIKNKIDELVEIQQRIFIKKQLCLEKAEEERQHKKILKRVESMKIFELHDIEFRKKVEEMKKYVYDGLHQRVVKYEEKELSSEKKRELVEWRRKNRSTGLLESYNTKKENIQGYNREKEEEIYRKQDNYYENEEEKNIRLMQISQRKNEQILNKGAKKQNRINELLNRKHSIENDQFGNPEINNKSREERDIKIEKRLIAKTKKNINKYEDLNLFRKDKYEVYQRIKKADSFVKDQQANNLMEKLRQIEDFL